MLPWCHWLHLRWGKSPCLSPQKQEKYNREQWQEYQWHSLSALWSLIFLEPLQVWAGTPRWTTRCRSLRPWQGRGCQWAPDKDILYVFQLIELNFGSLCFELQLKERWIGQLCLNKASLFLVWIEVAECRNSVKAHSNSWEQNQGDGHQRNVSCQVGFMGFLKSIPEYLLVNCKLTWTKILNFIFACLLVSFLLLNSLTDEFLSCSEFALTAKF